MAIASKPFYWIDCDYPDCLTRYPPEDGEASAWDDSETAVELAGELGWRIDGTDTHWCPDHTAHWLCAECGDDLPDPIPDPEHRLCSDCEGAT